MGNTKSAMAMTFVLAALAAVGVAGLALIATFAEYGDGDTINDPVCNGDPECMAKYDAAWELRDGELQRRMLAPAALAVTAGLGAVALAGCAVACAVNRSERTGAPPGNVPLYGGPPVMAPGGPPR